MAELPLTNGRKNDIFVKKWNRPLVENGSEKEERYDIRRFFCRDKGKVFKGRY